MVARYIYDAWGNCTISGNTTVAKANPIRYRGYYYDEDTGLYYCNARYYSPKWRRFISPDDTAHLDPSSVNGLNQYCYCGNDPVNRIDPSGHFPLLAAIIIAVIGVAGGVLGGLYEGKLSYNGQGQNGTDAEGSLSTWDRINNILLGTVLGLAVGGAVVMLGAMGLAAILGPTTYVAALGGTAINSFAFGALAYNSFAILSMFWTGSETELIEWENQKLPH